jgi:hypothetical protein
MLPARVPGLATKRPGASGAAGTPLPGQDTGQASLPVPSVSGLGLPAPPLSSAAAADRQLRVVLPDRLCQTVSPPLQKRVGSSISLRASLPSFFPVCVFNSNTEYGTSCTSPPALTPGHALTGRGEAGTGEIASGPSSPAVACGSHPNATTPVVAATTNRGLDSGTGSVPTACGRLKSSMPSAKLEHEAQTLGLRDSRCEPPAIGSPQQTQILRFMVIPQPNPVRPVRPSFVC